MNMFRKTCAIFSASIALLLSMQVLAQDSSRLQSKTPLDTLSDRLSPPSGSSDTKMISEGSIAPPDSVPFIVAIIGSKAPRGKEFLGQFCAGSMIEDVWVLTAGHCVSTSRGVAAAADLDVYVGTQDFRGGDRIPVKSIIRHPDYNSELGDNDIALLELERSPKAGTNFKKVQIVSSTNEAEAASPGTPVEVAGWGLTETGVRSKRVRFTSIKLVDSRICNKNILQKRLADLDLGLSIVGRNFRVPQTRLTSIRDEIVSSRIGPLITDNMICAGDPAPPLNAQHAADSCSNDSGGPLYRTTPDGRILQVGIVSWGEGCGVPMLYGVYTRVAKFADWVKNTTINKLH